MKIDSTDIQILKHLQDDARISLRELGKKLSIPHTTVFTRVNKLVKNGIIKKFSAVLHPHELGFRIGYVIIDAPPSESKSIAESIAKLNEAQHIFRTFDGKIIVKAVVQNGTHHGLERFLGKIGGHSQMRVYPIDEVIKFDHSIHQDTLEEIKTKKD